jgi:predicted DNA-binding transcriptional regulator YafY
MGETDPTRRALMLLDLLQSRPVWTGPELAERLGVTTRSVRRDIDRLRSLGYPVHSTHGAGGGYQLGAGRALPLLLEDEEAVAVAVSLRLAAGGTVAGASEAALRTLAKLDQVMPPRLRAEVRAVHDAVSTIDGATAVVDGEVLLGLARACRDLVRVRFGYRSHVGEETRRWVEPVRLVATGRRWYLMAWDVDRDDWRTFRLDRMSEVRPGTWRFTPREHPDPVEFVHRAVSTAPYRYVARLRVHATAAEVREWTHPSAERVVEEGPDRCLVITGRDSFTHLAEQLVWLPYEVEVLEPPELRDELRRLAARFARAADRPAVS